MATIPTYMVDKGTLPAGHGIIKTSVAASEVPFGAVITRVADGTCGAAITSGLYHYLGVAIKDGRKQSPYDGFYAAGKKVPYIATGVAEAWLLGGQTIDAGNFVKIADNTLGAGTEAIGVVLPEGTPTTKTLYSMGRVLDAADSGASAYKQNFTTLVGDVLTFGSATIKGYLDLHDGDALVLDSDNHAEFNRVADADYSTVACKLVKDGLAHSGNLYAYKCTQILMELI